jgi:hypothetical protein
MRTAGVIAATLCAVLSGPVVAAQAQRDRRTTPQEDPAIDIVQTAGCVERRAGTPETWWLARAADTRVTQAGVFSTAQIEAAKALPPGAQTFQLVGVADFLDTEGLLKSGRRQEFTTPENANATGALRVGRKVLVKGMFITSGEVKRINLLNAVSLADTCG